MYRQLSGATLELKGAEPSVKIFYCDHFVLPLPAGHRFPMAKYALLRKRVEASPLAGIHTLTVPDPATDEELLRVHEADYLERVKSGSLSEAEVRRIGFPWSPALVERSRRSVGGTIDACRSAALDGLAVNLAGGTHHASTGHGEGFCVFNDAAVAARAMQAERRAKRVLIVDCDVHQGNGTANIFAGDPTVFTLSIHGANNYPFRKGRSDLDIALPDGTPGSDYLAALKQGLETSLAAARPELAIYLAGADPYAKDRYGKLALTTEDLAERDRLIFQRCRRAGLPVATVMSGGYATDVNEIVDLHFTTVSIAGDFATG